VRAATLARISLLLVAAATFLAIFYAQELKREDPLLKAAWPPVVTFRPTGPLPPHIYRDAHFHLRTSVNDVLVVSVVSRHTGRIVAVLPRLAMRAYEHRSPSWDGRTATGALAPPGDYTLSVHFVHAGDTVKPALTIRLEAPAA
jgi:hypothetical protein